MKHPAWAKWLALNLAQCYNEAEREVVIHRLYSQYRVDTRVVVDFLAALDEAYNQVLGQRGSK